MNYIAQIKGFWLLHEKHALNSTDTALYFYLLEVCNSTNWVNPFKRNTAKLMADLKLSRSSLERSRKRLTLVGILKFRSVNGTPNVTYTLTDLEAIFRERFTDAEQGNDTGNEQGTDKGADQLNKNSKQKPKQIVVVSCAQAFAFYVETKNNRILKDRFGLDNNALLGYFKIFYDSKIDLGDLNNKTIEEIARNFYYWLPKHLTAAQKEKSCVKKESFGGAAAEQSQRGVAAVMKFANVKMREA
jgi:predicted transcriptional regulator